jgi:hypothetical protein
MITTLRMLPFLSREASMPGKRDAPEEVDTESAKKKAKPKGPVHPPLPTPTFDIAKFVECEKDIPAEELGVDVPPDFPYGQVRPVNELQVETIKQAMLVAPPRNMVLTVWPQQSMFLAPDCPGPVGFCLPSCPFCCPLFTIQLLCCTYATIV